MEENKENLNIIDLWNSVDGDNTLRLDYDLNPLSIVFDIGAYKGDFAEKIIKKHNCIIFCFEPIYDFYIDIKKRKIKNIKAYNFGLGSSNRRENIFLSDNASSIFEYSNENLENKNIEIMDIHDFIIKNNIERINLMKINVEGCEYEILDRLISTGLINIIDNIQVQFHDFIENSLNMKNKISEDLNKTHYLTYKYEFIWENWRKKDL